MSTWPGVTALVLFCLFVGVIVGTRIHGPSCAPYHEPTGEHGTVCIVTDQADQAHPEYRVERP